MVSLNQWGSDQEQYFPQCTQTDTWWTPTEWASMKEEQCAFSGAKREDAPSHSVRNNRHLKIHLKNHSTSKKHHYNQKGYKRGRMTGLRNALSSRGTWQVHGDSSGSDSNGNVQQERSLGPHNPGGGKKEEQRGKEEEEKEGKKGRQWRSIIFTKLRLLQDMMTPPIYRTTMQLPFVHRVE